MTKRLFFIIFCCAVLLLGVYAHFTYAQKEPPESPQTLQQIESKLNELTTISRAQKDLDKKLDRVLSNQEKIIAELGIIKIRASR